MKSGPKSLIVRCVCNARGQMAIFMALIFQVLFVFFAMAINIGLLVHDKINLQNSVDLGAYYGAQKMAEVMNAMAHVNYQIRQDYKLLAYRMRVIGSLGYDEHPIRSSRRDEALVAANYMRENLPSCVSWDGWVEIHENSTSGQPNVCRSPTNRVSRLPIMPVVSGLGFGFAIRTRENSIRARADIERTCLNQTRLNWRFAALSNYAYRIMVKHRKEAFLALARNLSADEGSMLDMDGTSIQEGIRLTVANNLTIANRESLVGGVEGIEVYNGLDAEFTGDRPPWVSEIFIHPFLSYIHHGEAGGGVSCQNRQEYINEIPPQEEQDSEWANIARATSNVPMHSASLGFEKNPWTMAYIGVKAQSAPRKPFAPFGSPVRVVARAFAKPFGGRMGPWHKKTWSQGDSSSGTGLGEIDVLTVPRSTNHITIDRPPDSSPDDYLPNFSKYPGDELGLKSNLALTFTPGLTRRNFQRFFTLANFVHFENLLTQDADPLALSQTNAPIPGGPVRAMELAGIAPNLFDITYYSIEPNFNKIYGSRGIWSQLQDTNGSPLIVPRDLGSTADNPVSIRSQVEFVNDGRRGDWFYKISDPFHMLTSWAQRRESDYSFDEERFGNCIVEVPERGPPSTGDCIAGGRTGYSVKLVSRAYLNFEDHRIGGEGAGGGQIVNPPPGDF